jgi:DNA-binding GntR family transcriptional regulator
MGLFLPLHRKVLEAFGKRSAEAARKAMQRLLSETLDFVSSHLRKPSESTRSRSVR